MLMLGVVGEVWMLMLGALGETLMLGAEGSMLILGALGVWPGSTILGGRGGPLAGESPMVITGVWGVWTVGVLGESGMEMAGTPTLIAGTADVGTWAAGGATGLGDTGDRLAALEGGTTPPIVACAIRFASCSGLSTSAIGDARRAGLPPIPIGAGDPRSRLRLGLTPTGGRGRARFALGLKACRSKDLMDETVSERSTRFSTERGRGGAEGWGEGRARVVIVVGARVIVAEGEAGGTGVVVDGTAAAGGAGAVARAGGAGEGARGAEVGTEGGTTLGGAGDTARCGVGGAGDGARATTWGIDGE